MAMPVWRADERWEFPQGACPPGYPEHFSWGFLPGPNELVGL